jgi:hypothetical protein
MLADDSANHTSQPVSPAERARDERIAQLERTIKEQTARAAADRETAYIAAIPAQVTAKDYPHLMAWHTDQDGRVTHDLAGNVYDVMKRLYADSVAVNAPVLPTVADAARAMERQLAARVKRLTGSAMAVPGAKQPAPGPTTITNDLTAARDAAPQEPETDEDYIQRGIAILEGRISA